MDPSINPNPQPEEQPQPATTDESAPDVQPMADFNQQAVEEAPAPVQAQEFSAPAPKNKGLIIGIIIAVIVLAGGAVTAALLLGGDKDDDKKTDETSNQDKKKDTEIPAIATAEELRQAIIDKKAFDCDVTGPEGQEATMQANDGFTRFRVQATDPESGLTATILVTPDTYYIQTLGMNLKQPADGSMDINSMFNEVNIDSKNDSGISSLVCRAPDPAKLEVPAGVEFLDTGSLMQ